MADDTFPTQAELVQVAEDAFRSVLDPDGRGTIDLQPGSDNAALVSVVTQVALRMLAYAADRNAAAITASSSGTDLDDHVRDVYGEQRKLSAASVGHVYLMRTGTAPTFIPGGSRFAVQAGGVQGAVEFGSNNNDVPVAQNVLTAAVPITCTVEGSVGNVALVAITAIPDPLPDSTWTLYVPQTGDPVLNGGPVDTIGGGRDEETDDELKARVLARPAIVQPATKPGVVQAAMEVPGIASAVAVEIGDGSGVLYAGDPSYQLPAALSLAIAANLEDWRTFGVPTPVRAFNPTTVQVTARVHMEEPVSNYDQAALYANAVAAVVRYFKFERKHPDEFFKDAIQTSIAKANPGTQSVELLSPTSDQRRPADKAYGEVTALIRYQVTPASISIQFLDPLTS
jgi:uncharacterized phage protein gp47/JayE